MKEQKHLEGEIIRIDGPVSVGANNLQKTIMVVETLGDYPQTIPVEWLKDKATTVATQYAIGDEVRIGYNLRGREWQGKYYPSFQGWEIELTGAGTGRTAGDGREHDPDPQTMPNEPSGNDDDNVPFFANHVLIMVTQITRENQRMRDCISALVPFLMEDYVVGVMTDDYKAAIELAIEATKTEAQNASR